MERKLIKRGLNRIILLPIILSVLYAGILIWQLNRTLTMSDWVDHTSQILTLSSETQRHTQFEESELRGYLVAHSQQFVDRFNHEDAIVDSLFDELHILTIDNPSQTHRIDSLMQIYWVWQTLARHSLLSSGSLAKTTSGVYEDPEQSSIKQISENSSLILRAGLIDSMRHKFGLINREEHRLYSERTAKFHDGTELLIIIISLSSITLGVVVGMNGRHHAKRFIDRFSAAIDETSRNRDLLQTMLLSIGDGIIVAGIDGTIILINSSAEKLTGWAADQAIGKNVAEVLKVVSEYDGFQVKNPVSAVLEEGHRVDYKGRMILPSGFGAYNAIKQIASPVRDGRQEIVAVVICFSNITEHRESQRQAERREREIRLLVDNSPDAIMRYANDLTISYANPAIEKMLGLKPKWLVGKRFKNVGIPEETYGPWEKSVQRVFETGQTVSFEIRYLTLRGFRIFDTQLVPEGELYMNNVQSGSNSKVESVISISRDVTDMKQVEQRLRDSEERFRTIVENSPDAFYTLRAVRENPKDRSSKIVNFIFEHINQRGAELITVSASECIGRRLSDVMPNNHARIQEFIEKYARILEGGKPAYEEYHVESSYVKNAKWLHSQYIPIGDVLAISTIDITSRTETVLALHDSEERFRQLVERASEAIFTTNREGRITYANPYIRELGTLGNEDITKYFFSDFILPKHRTRIKQHFFRQFLSQKPFSYVEAPFMSKEGVEIWLGVTSSLRMNGNEVEGFDCIATDITARKIMESELQLAREHESRQIREATDLLRISLRQPIEQIRSMSKTLASFEAGGNLDEFAKTLAFQAERVLAALDV